MEQFTMNKDSQDNQVETKKSQLSEQDQLQLKLMDGVTGEYQSKPYLGFFEICQERADYLSSSNDYFDSVKYGSLTPENEKMAEDDARDRFPNMPSPQYKARRLKSLVSPIDCNCIMNMSEVERINEIARITAPTEQDLWNRHEGVGVDEDDYDNYYGGRVDSWASSGMSFAGKSEKEKQELKKAIPPHPAKTPTVPPGKEEAKADASAENLSSSNAATTKPSDGAAKKNFYDSYGASNNNNNSPREKWVAESGENIGNRPIIGTDFQDTWTESKVKAGMAPDAIFSKDGKTGPIDPTTKRPKRYFAVDGKKVRDASFAPTDSKTYRRSPEAAERVTVLARLTSKAEFERVMNLPDQERDTEIARITKGRTMFNTAVRPTDVGETTPYLSEPNKVVRRKHSIETGKPLDAPERFELENEDSPSTVLRVYKATKADLKGHEVGPEYLGPRERRNKYNIDIMLPDGYIPSLGEGVNETQWAHSNGFTGGSLDGSYPASEGEHAIDQESYHRLHRAHAMDNYSTLYHEIGYGYTATPKYVAVWESEATKDDKGKSQPEKQETAVTYVNMTRAKGVPTEYYLSNAAEMTNALRTVKEVSFDVNDRLLICSADFDAAYKADWKPKNVGSKANEQRKRIPMEIRRLYYTLDQMDEDEKKEFYDWVDENNLLPQVRLNRNREKSERSSFDTQA